MKSASSALTIVPLAMRDLIHDSAAPSELNTAGTELPSCSRTMTTTLRLPVLVASRGGDRRGSRRLAGLHNRRNIHHRPPPFCHRRRRSRPFISSAIASRILWRKDESGLVGQPRSRRMASAALALHLIAEDRDGREIAAERQLVAGEQRPAVIVKSFLQARQRKRRAPFGRRHS